MRLPRVLLALALFAPALAGCIAPSAADDIEEAAAAPTRLAASEWKARLSESRFDRMVSSVVYLRAEDGTQLSLTLHLPDGLGADESIPTLLQLTPYQAGRPSNPVAGTAGPGRSWGDFVKRGAAYVEANARGTDASSGCLDFGGSADRADAQTFVEWVRAQPWSNGVVVTDGVSHPGMGSVVAHAAVPDLTAALTHAPVVSYYRDEWYQGAKFENQFNGPLYQVVELTPTGYLAAEALTAQPAACTGKTALDFSPIDGPFTSAWADRDLARHASEARAPILLTHGFVDANVHPEHTQTYWDALPPDAPKHLIMGWWYHGWPDMRDHPAETFTDVRHRWLDAMLFGIDNGLTAEPRVLVEDSTGGWHESDTWPLAPSERVTLHATATGELAIEASEAGEVSYTDALRATRGVWRDAHVAFRTEPLAQTRLVNGAPIIHLAAKSNADATKWVVYLMDEAPDGSWQRITHGYADSHTHGAEDAWLPMTPGTAYRWNILTMPTAVVVEAGHRIVLVVASSDSQIASNLAPDRLCLSDYRGGCSRFSGIAPATTHGRATNTILAGPEGTTIQLDWVDPTLTAKPRG